MSAKPLPHHPAAENAASERAGALPGDSDHRVTCNSCKHLHKLRMNDWRCRNYQSRLHARLGITNTDIGPELAALKQDCPGYEAKETA